MDVTIVGTGQMAVMCATLLRDNGHGVTLLGREGTIGRMRETGTSAQLPDVPLPVGCALTDDPAAADSELLVVAVPTQMLDEALAPSAGMPICPAVCCAKGIERQTLRRPTEVVLRRLGTPLFTAALSGPNIAAEVVARKPAGAVVACEDAGVAERVRDAFATDYFRVYTTDDVVGVELAGATKNVIAIAAGIIDGLGLGNNAKASLVTRGLVEITRLGVAMGARPETFAGLAGMGDLMTTCVSPEGAEPAGGRDDRPRHEPRRRAGVAGQRLRGRADDAGGPGAGRPARRGPADRAGGGGGAVRGQGRAGGAAGPDAPRAQGGGVGALAGGLARRVRVRRADAAGKPAR